MDKSSDEAPPLVREALYERIWTEPVLILASRYGISNVGLAKICRKHAIPQPGRGYWQKLRAGKRVKRTPLPPIGGFTKSSKTIVLAYRAPILASEATIPAPVAAQQERERTPDQHIIVASSLRAARPLHPLVQRTAAALRSPKPFDRRLEVPVSDSILDIRVTPAIQDRALRIMDALIKALEARHYPVQCRPPRPVWRPYTGSTSQSTSWPGQAGPGIVTCVQLGDQDVLLALRERQQMVKRTPMTAVPVSPSISARHAIALEVLGRSPRRALAVPVSTDDQESPDSGQLILSIPHHVGGWSAVRTWKDGKRTKLEDVLNDVIVGIVAAAEEFRSLVAHWRREEEERHKAELQRIELDRRRATEAALAKEIERQATAWSLARTIREYVSAARAVSHPGLLPSDIPGLAPPGMTIDAWLTWAEAYAQRIDPTYPSEIDVLET